MDIAALSVVMNQQQVRNDASLAIMNQIKDVMTNQGEQLTDMLSQSSTPAPHPTHGHNVDIKL